MRRMFHRAGWRPAVLAAAGLALVTPTPAFAGSFWTGFTKYWSSFIGDADGVVVTVLVIGAIALLIITRGKWGR